MSTIDFGRKNVSEPLDSEPKKEEENLGERAQETGVALGTIGCPHCGAVAHGSVLPKCGICDRPYFTEGMMKNAGYTGETEQGRGDHEQG